jgi:pSer/pThr/pTyr-binding forkhead associated (FHA) protein
VDAFTLSLWALRLAFLALLYLFLFFVARAMLRDLRAAVGTAGQAIGRLVVITSPAGTPPVGASIPVDAVTTIGRDVNNAVEVDDPFASAEHALLSYRGRVWYVEDRGSTNGTFVNGEIVDAVRPIHFGDEIQVGQVRLRLDRVAAQ